MDEDRELEELRRRRMAQVQQDAVRQQLQEEQTAAVEAQRQTALRVILTAEARERLGTLKMTRPDIVNSVEDQLIMLAQSGRIQTPIDDETLKQILQRVLPKKREITIKRR